jgi:glyceraldehyde-3-phosphate dehydrogenase (NAD(P))
VTKLSTPTWWNQAIVVPETIDAIRALSGRERDGGASIAKTNAALGIGTPFP